MALGGLFKSRQQRHSKRAVEITHKMHQGERKNNFNIRGLGQCRHRLCMIEVKRKRHDRQRAVVCQAISFAGVSAK